MGEKSKKSNKKFVRRNRNRNRNRKSKYKKIGRKNTTTNIFRYFPKTRKFVLCKTNRTK